MPFHWFSFILHSSFFWAGLYQHIFHLKWAGLDKHILYHQVQNGLDLTSTFFIRNGLNSAITLFLSNWTGPIWLFGRLPWIGQENSNCLKHGTEWKLRSIFQPVLRLMKSGYYFCVFFSLWCTKHENPNQFSTSVFIHWQVNEYCAYVNSTISQVLILCINKWHNFSGYVFLRCFKWLIGSETWPFHCFWWVLFTGGPHSSGK